MGAVENVSISADKSACRDIRQCGLKTIPFTAEKADHGLSGVWIAGLNEVRRFALVKLLHLGRVSTTKSGSTIPRISASFGE